MTAAWNTYKAGDVPKMLDAQMNAAFDSLVAAVEDRRSAEARQAAINVAQASLDLQLQYKPLGEIDLARFSLWVRQLLLDTDAGEAGAVAGDATTLEWVWDRVAHTVARF